MVSRYPNWEQFQWQRRSGKKQFIRIVRMKHEKECDVCGYWIPFRGKAYRCLLGRLDQFYLHKHCFDIMTPEDLLKKNLEPFFLSVEKQEFKKKYGIVKEEVEKKPIKIKVKYKLYKEKV